MIRITKQELQRKIDLYRKEHFIATMRSKLEPNDIENIEHAKRLNDYMEKLGEKIVALEIEEEMKNGK